MPYGKNLLGNKQELKSTSLFSEVNLCQNLAPAFLVHRTIQVEQPQVLECCLLYQKKPGLAGLFLVRPSKRWRIIIFFQLSTILTRW